MPWNDSFRQSHAYAKYFTEQDLAIGYYFVLTFEAFDVYLPSVGFVHKSDHSYKMYNYNYNRISLERNIAFSPFMTEFRVTFLARVAKQIILKYPVAPKPWKLGIIDVAR